MGVESTDWEEMEPNSTDACGSDDHGSELKAIQRFKRVAASILVLAALASLAALVFRDDSHEFGWSDWLGTEGIPIAMSHQGVPADPNQPDLQGFIDAVETHGYRYLETDVRLVDGTSVEGESDRVLVALHHVWGRLPDLKALNNRTHQAPKVERLLSEPALAGVRWNFELKGGDVDTAVELRRLLDLAGARDRVCVSFGDIKSQDLVEEIRNILSLQDGCSCASFAEKSFFFDFDFATEVTAPFRRSTGHLVSCVQVLHQLITQSDVDQAHERGIAIHAWEMSLPDTPVRFLLPAELDHLADVERMSRDRMIELLDMGVDGILTDNPSLLRDVLEERGEWHD